ncbi:MAG: hypothetical protein A4E57_01166 [Syntrophorhabdaceae bacterium PtaU1.Bin034]|nr:MAG: hypothetical protein A4E57_01166 [Syntrophorhabdaceae bacterium PtaU1.Bin034]
MVFFRCLTPAMLLVLLSFLPFTASAQDMDSLEGIYRQQYEQYTSQENALQQQIDNLAGLKSQVDSLIGQVANMPAASYGQEADRYRQLELLLPSATRYSQELEQKQRQLTEVQRQKAELRSKILERQSALPIWWTQ